jgi:hypothetical protein
MNFLFGIEQPYIWWKAILFYISHFCICVAMAALLGLMLAIETGVKEHAHLTGTIIAVIYSAAMTILVVHQRKLAGKHYGWLVVIVPVAAFSGAIGGMVVPAILTTRTNAKEVAEVVREVFQ